MQTGKVHTTGKVDEDVLAVAFFTEEKLTTETQRHREKRSGVLPR
jgi:hypothetical protein